MRRTIMSLFLIPIFLMSSFEAGIHLGKVQGMSAYNFIPGAEGEHPRSRLTWHADVPVIGVTFRDMVWDRGMNYDYGFVEYNLGVYFGMFLSPMMHSGDWINEDKDWWDEELWLYTKSDAYAMPLQVEGEVNWRMAFIRIGVGVEADYCRYDARGIKVMKWDPKTYEGKVFYEDQSVCQYSTLLFNVFPEVGIQIGERLGPFELGLFYRYPLNVFGSDTDNHVLRNLEFHSMYTNVKRATSLNGFLRYRTSGLNYILRADYMKASLSGTNRIYWQEFPQTFETDMLRISFGVEFLIGK